MGTYQLLSSPCQVTQIRNAYDKGAPGIPNGTQGVGTAIDAAEQTPTVVTDETR